VTAPALEVAGLRKRFRGVTAVDGVDLTVAPGEIVGMIGDNGAGKTTTLRAVMGEVSPDAGRVRIAGSADPAARRGVGYVAQDAGLYPDLTGRENLDFVARARGLSGEARDAAVGRALELADLGDAAERLTREYSGGMSQRLGLAAAFLGDPSLVVLDEAFVGLDPGAALRFRDHLLARAGAGGAALVCSHHLDLLAKVADRVLYLTGGRVACELPGGDVAALERCFE